MGHTIWMPAVTFSGLTTCYMDGFVIGFWQFGRYGAPRALCPNYKIYRVAMADKLTIAKSSKGFAGFRSRMKMYEILRIK